ncbi:TetR family transcriptional regulator [Actinopolyspora erythraea]|uniref:TetR family transcriptional regulator n=1 Tax=Actinopolyspora erythraea TaxID=414996 RepID=A0A099D7B9_9ACTN|nr:TetR/AcrR family transcriptional regulator [Actinopolyspora erythraea]ASU80978.1 TetR family transcriptional regulator [Actinopolyspora erythraea]KGI81904.1 TetR family transcriptional regulator [Actinopolyspora erythraea]
MTGGNRVSRGQRGSERRAELLSIAAEMFAVRGFAATTVREIADEAGILSGSLYHHFESKEAMVDEILRGYLSAQLERFRRVVEAGYGPYTTVGELIHESFAALHRHRWAMAILHNEAGRLAEFDRFGYIGSANREFERVWVRVLREGQRSGVFRAELSPRLAHRFIRDSVAASVRWYNPSGRMSVQGIAEQYTRIFRDGMAAPGGE